MIQSAAGGNFLARREFIGIRLAEFSEFSMGNVAQSLG